MQQACGTKVRPNSGKNPGVLRAKTRRTSRQSSLASRPGRSNSRASEKSTSRASQRSTRSKASVASKSSRRARSAGSSKREAAAMSPIRLLLSQTGTALAKAKVVVEAAAEDVTTATRARHRGQKTAKATRAAEIHVDQWRQQTQTETPFLLAQRHRNRHG